MKIPFRTWIKITVFLFIGIAFAGTMVLYSNSKTQMCDNEVGLLDTKEGTNRHLEKTFDVKEGQELRLDTEVGDVLVEGGASNVVEVVVDIEGSEKRVNDFDVEMKTTEKGVQIRGTLKDYSFLRFDFSHFRVHYRIKVPDRFNIKGSTAGGDVTIRRVAGNHEYETSGGDIVVESVEGDISFSTSGGDIEAKDIKGLVHLETSGGCINGTGISGESAVETSGGSIEMDIENGKVNAETSGGDITVRLHSENEGMDLSTSGGDIHIYVPEKIKANLDASTSGGSVKCELPITVQGEIEESNLAGKINGGGKLIKAETSGGSIRVMIQR